MALGGGAGYAQGDGGRRGESERDRQKRIETDRKSDNQQDKWTEMGRWSILASCQRRTEHTVTGMLRVRSRCKAWR